MTRRLFNALAAVSTVLCIVTISLWIRSEWIVDGPGVGRANRAVWLRSGGGEMCVVYASVPRGTGNFCLDMDLDGKRPTWSRPRAANEQLGVLASLRLDLLASILPLRLHLLSFHSIELGSIAFYNGCANADEFGFSPLAFVPAGHRFPPLTWTSAMLPYWLLCALFALLPMVKLVQTALRKTKKPGLCAACGYDLRATPDRCPECGTVATDQAVQSRA